MTTKPDPRPRAPRAAASAPATPVAAHIAAHRVLGLDCSSTCIGWSLADGSAWGHYDLTGDIAARCAQAAQHIDALLDTHAPALVIIESPVARFAKAVIPQARISGAVLAVLSRHLTLWHEVAPQISKVLLAGHGAATKDAMITAAASRLGLVGDIVTIGGKRVLLDVVPVLTEDEADAYGKVLLAGHGAATKDEMILAAAARFGLHGDIVTIGGKRVLCDVVPMLTEDEADAYGKVLLAGHGAATKDEMILAAAARFGLHGDIVTIGGKRVLLDVAPVLTEDEADAYGLALAGMAVKVVRS